MDVTACKGCGLPEADCRCEVDHLRHEVERLREAIAAVVDDMRDEHRHCSDSIVIGELVDATSVDEWERRLRTEGGE